MMSDITAHLQHKNVSRLIKIRNFLTPTIGLTRVGNALGAITENGDSCLINVKPDGLWIKKEYSDSFDLVQRSKYLAKRLSEKGIENIAIESETLKHTIKSAFRSMVINNKFLYCNSISLDCDYKLRMYLTVSIALGFGFIFGTVFCLFDRDFYYNNFINANWLKNLAFDFITLVGGSTAGSSWLINKTFYLMQSLTPEGVFVQFKREGDELHILHLNKEINKYRYTISKRDGEIYSLEMKINKLYKVIDHKNRTIKKLKNQ